MGSSGIQVAPSNPKLYKYRGRFPVTGRVGWPEQRQRRAVLGSPQGHSHTVSVEAAVWATHTRHSFAAPVDTLVLPQGIYHQERITESWNGWVGRDLKDDFIQTTGCSEAFSVLPVTQFPLWKVRTAIPLGFQQIPASAVGCSWGFVVGAVLLQTAGKQSPVTKDSFDRAVQGVCPLKKGIHGIQPCWGCKGAPLILMWLQGHDSSTETQNTRF